ncbi:ATPase WRNIP1, putative [Entamoeba dispar SAW760]|uniref:ATPase WRNIP1, putative n=1 Tax=Entamoeba dispar (strain ATCC PRA-260 / SAW760) TaxID=370354 RepID=B0EGY1_ENTDS|nr:ATPase WRNIP1, putative [Entamoeba dispar SAW760]EDR26196.1 ATPase WRNIP1, putative [Entamoeba dispar SAW760]|eukprot:EDR26196.1 ATPase WRNIP1, putative [Entamoeba dispar SAW760]
MGFSPQKSTLESFFQIRRDSNSDKDISYIPLAERQRPKRLEDIIGQESAIGIGTPFNSMILNDSLQSTILFGPPGSGKTTIARIIKNMSNSFFVQISSVTTSKEELKNVIEQAKERKKREKKDTILFVDEIHTLNKLQQDIFLPAIENGSIILIGATTENPSFQLNNALMSRCNLVILKRLENESINKIIKKAIKEEYQNNKFIIDEAGINIISKYADGDARNGLNCLEFIFNYFNHLSEEELKEIIKSNESENNTIIIDENDCTISKKNELENTELSYQTIEEPEVIHITLTSEIISKFLQKQNFQYDKSGEDHYNTISAFHKSMRGGDENAAVYWLGRMIFSGENPKYVARRMIRFATEDIGLADTNAMVVAMNTFQAVEILGYPDCKTVLAECCLYLTRAKKSTAIYKATLTLKKMVKEQPNYIVPIRVSTSSEHPTETNQIQTFLPDKLAFNKVIEYDRFTKPINKETIQPSTPKLFH